MEKPNPFENRPAFKVPVSTAITDIKVEPVEPQKIEEVKEILEKESDEGIALQKTLAIKMSPTLHQKYKIICATEGMTMQDDAFAYIKNRVKKGDKKNK